MKSKIEISVADEKKGKELLKSALEAKLRQIELSLQRTLMKLETFEKKYNMESRIFYNQFIKGKLQESDDFIDWAGEYEIYRELKKEQKIVQEMLKECK
ncbi:MAG: hypothetical protein J7L47_03235 [Candidatus Odinarchaeota archaeon]|nr:hypothetical protein [Candidatus Odinarchaeota archaeon]